MEGSRCHRGIRTGARQSSVLTVSREKGDVSTHGGGSPRASRVPGFPETQIAHRNSMGHGLHATGWRAAFVSPVSSWSGSLSSFRFQGFDSNRRREKCEPCTNADGIGSLERSRRLALHPREGHPPSRGISAEDWMECPILAKRESMGPTTAEFAEAQPCPEVSIRMGRCKEAGDDGTSPSFLTAAPVRPIAAEEPRPHPPCQDGATVPRKPAEIEPRSRLVGGRIAATFARRFRPALALLGSRQLQECLE